MPDDLSDSAPRGASVSLEPLPDSPDPVEIAMDMERGDPSPESPARRLLISQNRLVTIQIASERAGVALKLLTGLAGVAAAVVLAILAWQASRSEALIVTPFSVPPELAQRGLSGEVVATRLLDGLATLQADTLSSRPQGAYANDWGEDVQVQIPQTGVSIGELQEFLRGWLGQETKITGEVVRTGTGYSVTARTGGEAGKTFSGTEEELDQLIAKAAEAVYGSSQTGRYAGWLADKGRRDEAIELYRAMSITGERKARALAFAEWSVLAGDPAERLRLAERAVTLDPRQATAYIALSAARGGLGHREAALQADRRAAELLEGPGRKQLPAWSAVLSRKEKLAAIASALGDHAGAAGLYQSAAEPTPDQPPIACERCSSAAYFYAARELARNHDPAGAERMMQRAAAIVPSLLGTMRDTLLVSNASARGDWPAALAGIEAPGVQAQYAQVPPATQLRVIAPTRAYLLAKVGRVAEAQALMAPTPVDCFDCVRVRGSVAAMAGDAREADRWFREAVRQGPSLPSGYAAWGEAKLAFGDVDGAIRMLRQAQERGPRWAQPLKLEGDALARKGDHRAAVERYEKAAERAPRWGALHLAWGESLLALGRDEEAKARFQQASRLALNPTDRSAVQRRLKVT